MLWKLLGIILSIATGPYRGSVDPQPFEAIPDGPQNSEDVVRAHEALQGENGDMRFPNEIEPSHAAIFGEKNRWPGYPGSATIPYYFTPEVQNDAKLVRVFEKAIKQYHVKTCIRFVKRTDEKDYIRIIKNGRTCWSFVGKLDRRWQPQNLSLGDGCEFIGAVVHELGHAIGLFHEHQRTDRDNYINIFPKNVAPGQMKGFNKYKKTEELTFGAKYDYTSIMHYGECAHSKDPVRCKNDKSLRTMVAKDGTKLLMPFERPGLNQNDIALIKNLYKC